MNRAVIADKNVQRSHHADESRESHRIPPTQILIIQQRCSDRSSRTHYPKRDDDGEYTANVQTKKNALDQGKLDGQESVEKNGVEDDCNRDQGAVPSLGNI